MIVATREQTARERAAIERIKECNPGVSAFKLANAIHDHSNNAVSGPDVQLIRNSGKPYYGILAVLRTAGVK